MTFGQRLKKLIEINDVTQRDVCKQLNIAVTTLNGYVNDHREPDYQTLKSLACYFKVSTDYLLGITDVPQTLGLPTDEKSRRLLYHYNKLDSNLQEMLIDHAKLLQKYNAVKPTKDVIK